MTKGEQNLLEKVFEAEIDGALASGPRLYQTKSVVAKRLADKGYLAEVEFTLGGQFPVVVRGYELTELGRLTYCTEVPNG